VPEGFEPPTNVGPLMACGRSGMGALDGDLRRVLGGKREGWPIAHMVL
jgi:hypothetical protein